MSSSVIIESATILLREGIEALLVIAALAAFLTKSGAQTGLRALYAGAGAALIASFGMAWVFVQYYNGAHDDLLEGVTMLVAAALMLYASGWMFLRQDPRAWQTHLKAQAEKALNGTGGWGLAAIAFLAVFREGAETVLFLQAVAQGANSDYADVMVGVAIGTVALVLLFWLTRVVSMRLPLRPVFVFTSAFLFLMALRFIGQGLQEFQELAWLPVHPADLPSWAIELGLNPSFEALGAQLVVALSAVATVAWSTRQAAPRTASARG